MKSSKPRHLLWFGFKMVIALCFLSYGLFAYLKLHSHVKLPSLHPPAFRTSPSSWYHHFEGTPKIAFLFLARRDLPLDFLWDSFFKVCISLLFTMMVRKEKMDGSVKIKDIFIKMKLHVFIKRMKWKCIILEIILMSISEC